MYDHSQMHKIDTKEAKNASLFPFHKIMSVSKSICNISESASGISEIDSSISLRCTLLVLTVKQLPFQNYLKTHVFLLSSFCFESSSSPLSPSPVNSKNSPARNKVYFLGSQQQSSPSKRSIGSSQESSSIEFDVVFIHERL